MQCIPPDYCVVAQLVEHQTTDLRIESSNLSKHGPIHQFYLENTSDKFKGLLTFFVLYYFVEASRNSNFFHFVLFC
jgi:hypothetical protein